MRAQQIYINAETDFLEGGLDLSGAPNVFTP